MLIDFLLTKIIVAYGFVLDYLQVNRDWSGTFVPTYPVIIVRLYRLPGKEVTINARFFIFV